MSYGLRLENSKTRAVAVIEDRKRLERELSNVKMQLVMAKGELEISGTRLGRDRAAGGC